jgi:hypothetical protein
MPDFSPYKNVWCAGAVIARCIICAAPNIDATGDGGRRFGDRVPNVTSTAADRGEPSRAFR